MLSEVWASQVELVVKNTPAKAGDTRDIGLVPGSGRPPGGGYGNPLKYSCLENRMVRGAWWAIVHRFAMSQTQLKPLSTQVRKVRSITKIAFVLRYNLVK